MKISVIVPIYNVEKYLKRCIKSLLGQTEPIYEIILVDDGSTDGTGRLADEIAVAHDTIRVIHKQNAGLGMARNTGLEHATGEYILFLDGDDYFDREMVAHFSAGTENGTMDAVLTGYEKVDENGIPSWKLQYEGQKYSGEEILHTFLPKMFGSLPDQLDSIDMGAANTLYRTELIRKYQVDFVSEREYVSEDLVFNFRFFLHAQQVALLPYTDYKYQTTAGSLTTRYRADRWALSKNLYILLETEIRENKLIQEYILRFQKSMFNYMRFCFAQEKKTISGHTQAQQLGAIGDICRDELVRRILDEYPAARLGKKQRLFLLLVKYRQTELLRQFVERDVISVK